MQLLSDLAEDAAREGSPPPRSWRDMPKLPGHHVELLDMWRSLDQQRQGGFGQAVSARDFVAWCDINDVPQHERAMRWRVVQGIEIKAAKLSSAKDKESRTVTAPKGIGSA